MASRLRLNTADVIDLLDDTEEMESESDVDEPCFDGSDDELQCSTDEERLAYKINKLW